MDPIHVAQTGFGLTVGAAALACGIAFQKWFPDQAKWLGSRTLPAVRVALIFTGASIMWGSTWGNTVLGWVNQLGSGWQIMSVLLTVGAIVAVIFVIARIWQNAVHMKTLTVVSTLPVAMTAIGGWVGAAYIWAAGFVAGTVGWALAAAFGVH